jgi:hypothetical protein
MRITFKNIFGIGCSIFAFTNGALGQTLQQQGIASTTQILNTSVLFAIGAREAEQALRGSFGWPTFQEGFVDRVYFRFDPDGYARFSTNPRLDEDVFEVICAESSTACLAKKPSLEIGLTVEGKIQIKIADITPQDTFYISDRKSELPLPPNILEPLDARLETLLASGGHLIVKREVEKIQEISLAGFSAVATYLRWVAQGQSPRVFPRGWPVPAQVEIRQVGQLTQPGAWVTPNVGPQQTQTTYTKLNGQQNANLRTYAPLTAQADFISPQNGVVSRTIGYGNSNFSQGQQNYRQVQLDPALNTVQSLERELAQLRAAQGNSGWQVFAEPINEGAIEFSQQAQARDLQTQGGFGYSAATQSEQQLPQDLRNDFNGVNRKCTQQEAAGIDHYSLEVLEARLYALEVAIVDMKRAFISEIRAMRNSPAFSAQQEVSPSVPSNTVNSLKEPESMDALENFLLERLSKRDPLPEDLAPVVDEFLKPEGDRERTRIFELLKQLEQGQEDTPNDASESLANMPETQPAGEFVTLSDYINQVLKSEAQTTPKAN